MKIRKSFLVLIFIISNINFLVAADYNIIDFGAVNDTTALSTDAINKAIEQCYVNGGGRVVIPSGNYKSGTITLKDNVNLYLEPGATLYASCSHDDFPRQKQAEYRSQKDPGGWYALIYAEGAKNISITGRGTIDGQGAKQVPIDTIGNDKDGRPRNILFISCKNVLVSGIMMRNSGIWNQHYLNCEDVTVDNINVYNHSNRNNDAIDIDGCRRFTLSNSIFDTDDDGITLKSTGEAACENITITNCIVSTHCNAIKCGTESTGGFRNIVISNCVVKPSRHEGELVYGTPIGVSGLSLEIVDGGIMEGVSVNNLVIEGTECPIFVRLGNRARKHIEEAPEPPMGIMRNIRISNVIAYNTGNYCSSITGIPGGKIENIYLSNIHIINKGGLKSGEYLPGIEQVKEKVKGYPSPKLWRNLPSSGLFIRHVKNISLSGMSFQSKNIDPRPVIIASDVDYLKMKDFTLDEKKDANNTILLESVKKVSFPPEIKSHVVEN